MGMRLLTYVVCWMLMLVISVEARTKTIGVYVHHPVADPECANALAVILAAKYKVIHITHRTLDATMLKDIDCLAFPGGLGDSDVFDQVLLDRKTVVQDYMKNGGRYLGICMGAYFAGSNYFDILDGVDTVRYIKRPGADVSRQDETISLISWNNKPHNMYFFDGCAIVGDIRKLKTIATYRNGDPMAAIQGRVGMIGCHPESLEYWYEEAKMMSYWHHGVHHRLLTDFVDTLMKQ